MTSGGKSSVPPNSNTGKHATTGSTSQTTGSNDIRRINHRCPKCAYEHWIPIDRLDAQLRCKECNSLFYFDATGSSVLGRKPIAARDPHAYGPVESPRNGADPFAWWTRLPGSVRILIEIGLAAGLLLLIASFFTGSSKATIPQDVAGKTAYAAEALVRGDKSGLEEVLSSGSSSFLGEWSKKVLPDMLTVNPEDTVTVRTEKVIENTNQGIAVVKAFINYASASKKAAPRKMEINFFWRIVDDQWQLDVERSLQYLK